MAKTPRVSNKNASMKKRILTKKKSAELLENLHLVLADAGLSGYQINMLHLIPAGNAVAPPKCHTEQLPNGHVIWVCD